jgi:hypothetical protein
MCQYHQKNNVCGGFTQVPEPTTPLAEKYGNMSKQELMLKLAETEGKYEALKDNPQTVNNDNRVVIVPPAFLTPDTYPQWIQSMPKLLHDALSKHPNNFITYLIKETNCNPDLPLFNSVKLTNKKEPFIQISDGEKYVYAPKKEIITQLIDNKREILQRYIDDNHDRYGEKLLKIYERYITYLEDNEDEAFKELEVQIICMLLNVSEVIGSDDWSKKLLNDLKVWDTPTIEAPKSQ